MIRVGIAGVGFMGWIHWLAYQKVAAAQVNAICTRDEKKRAGDWTGIQGNFGPPGEQVDLAGIKTYSEFAEMLQDDDLDVIDICLPPHLHADATVAALEAGKHVFCEKPMALSVAECQRMVDAGTKAGKQIFIGHVLAYFPEYVEARRVIDSGEYGKLLGGSFKRIISDPTWLPDFYDLQRVGGPLLDLHVHDAHYIRLLFGMPTGYSTQGRMRGDAVEFCNTLFHFDTPYVVSATCGVINQQGRPFTHGFEIHLEKATLQYEYAFADGKDELFVPLRLYDSEGKVTRPELGDGDPVRAFEGEIQEVATCVAENRPSSLLSGDLARDAIEICHRQAEAVQAAAG